MFFQVPGNATRAPAPCFTMRLPFSTSVRRFITHVTGRIVALLSVFVPINSAPNALALDTIKSFRIENGMAIVEFADNPGTYYLLEESGDFLNWGPADMSLGLPSELELDPNAPRRLFRVIPFSQFAPLDSDGDGMDDVYELNNPDILNPLDPSDGSKLNPSGSGMTNYQHYLLLFGITSYKILQREGREVSLFNFGSPSATFEANSREQSLFNFGSPSATFEANSREISIFNGEAVPYSDLLQIETREVSVFNFGSPSATLEVITREVSALNFDEP